MGGMASQITSLIIVYSTIYSGANQRKHQSSTSLAFVRWIHRWPGNSLHKWPVTQKMFPCYDIIMHESFGSLENAYELLNLGALKFHLYIRYLSFTAWVRYFVWNFKGTHQHSTQNFSHTYRKIWFYTKFENQSIFQFRGHKHFLKDPLIV